MNKLIPQHVRDEFNDRTVEVWKRAGRYTLITEVVRARCLSCEDWRVFCGAQYPTITDGTTYVPSFLVGNPLHDKRRKVR